MTGSSVLVHLTPVYFLAIPEPIRNKMCNFHSTPTQMDQDETSTQCCDPVSEPDPTNSEFLIRTPIRIVIRIRIRIQIRILDSNQNQKCLFRIWFRNSPKVLSLRLKIFTQPLT
jgi:hypothetical protein